MNLNNLQKPIKDSIAQIDFNNKAVAVQLISFPRSTTCNNHENELWGVTWKWILPTCILKNETNFNVHPSHKNEALILNISYFT